MTLLEKEVEHLKTIITQREVRENELAAELKKMERLQFEEKQEREAQWSEKLQKAQSDIESEKDKNLEL